MIEILVTTQAISVDSILGLRYGRGFPVVVKKCPCHWGGSERLPEFIIVRVTDTDDIEGWTDAWLRKTSYAVLAHDPETDFFRVKIFPQDQKDICQITVLEMQAFLINWGAEKIEPDVADLGVVFELTAMDAIHSRGLFSFGAEDDFVKYTELLYDPAVGEHQVVLDYSLSKITEAEIRRVLEEAHFVVDSIDHAKGICIFTGYRHIMIGLLEQQVEANFHKVMARRQWRFSDNTVMDAMLHGGVKEMTLAEADADVTSVSDEV